MDLSYPLNPAYGAGAYRRRVRVRLGPGAATAVLDDNNHAMWCRLHYDGVAVTAVESGMWRVPYSPCPAATVMFRNLVGTRLDISVAAYFAGGRARQHCTHLFDLAALCLSVIRDAVPTRTIDIILHDALNGPQLVEARADGELIHAWWIENEVIVAPEGLAGRHVTQGFVRWASATMEGIRLDAALMLQKGVMVARARRYIIDATPGRAIPDAGLMLGSCFTFSEPQVSAALELGRHVKDFSDGVIESAWPE